MPRPSLLDDDKSPAQSGENSPHSMEMEGRWRRIVCSATAVWVQSMNATLRIVSVSVSVFSTTRCQSGNVIVAWSECRTVPRA